MLFGAVFVIADEVDEERNQGAEGNKEEEVPPHTDTSRRLAARLGGKMVKPGPARRTGPELFPYFYYSAGTGPRQGFFWPGPHDVVVVGEVEWNIMCRPGARARHLGKEA